MAGGGVHFPRPARPRRLCQPPWTQPSSKKPRPLFRRNQASRSNPAKRQPLFGREREEGKDSHSRQWRLSMAVFLNRNKRP